MTVEDIKLDDSERTKCEVWTRVMGYHRPLESFNRGKKSEFYARKCFTEEKVRAHLAVAEDLSVSMAAE